MSGLGLSVQIVRSMPGLSSTALGPNCGAGRAPSPVNIQSDIEWSPDAFGTGVWRTYRAFRPDAYPHLFAECSLAGGIRPRNDAPVAAFVFLVVCAAVLMGFVAALRLGTARSRPSRCNLRGSATGR